MRSMDIGGGGGGDDREDNGNKVIPGICLGGPLPLLQSSKNSPFPTAPACSQNPTQS